MNELHKLSVGMNGSNKYPLSSNGYPQVLQYL
jgi:hypothetical protein